jgi:hypothetical protein
MRTSKFPGATNAGPVTVVIREVSGWPRHTARPTAAAVPTFRQTSPMSGGRPPRGTWRPVSSGRVETENAFQPEPLVACVANRCLHRRDSLGFVALDCDETVFAAKRSQQNPGAGDNTVGAFAHQAIVTTDVGLAFGAVQDQRYVGRCALDLGTGCEYRATESNDATLRNALREGLRCGVFPVSDGAKFVACAIFPVALNDQHAGTRHLCSRRRQILKISHDPGCGGV